MLSVAKLSAINLLIGGLSGQVLDYQYALTKANCNKCYSYSTACIANDFNGGVCCPKDNFES